ncbi:ElyC/SanA/YdcF family protein [Nocardiopsis sp. N85]|uniref:SanA/YdcF family protein n=1 Tax=Nocardiopsis sp. N85 TaxID=3029400 RepID=UPI00237F056D|nr:ElyC/SanA/YdcF family protein [Nocardiopsis sp. N85]MDE3719826.1 ElyC/SanA/YdcF family protein [Nocardiopsis sp. N85]
MTLWIVVAGACAAALTPYVWLMTASAGRRRTTDTVPRRPVAVVLGAAAWTDGPSPLLARRLDLAVRLYLDDRVERVIVSGDNREVSCRETDTMTDYLLAHGVPADRVDADPHGYRTWDTCVRVRDLFGVRAATMVTQSFHLPRTIALARAAGIDAVGVGDPSMGARRRSTVIGYAREAAAAVKALRDAVLRPAPARSGP